MADLVAHSFRGDEDHPLRQAGVELRLSVFVEEQKVPFVLEVDARDYASSTIHFVIEAGAEVIAAARLLPEEDTAGRFHVGRVVVRREERGTGLGLRLLEAISTHVSDSLVPGQSAQLVLAAQENAVGFYQRAGYHKTDRDRFLEANIWHCEMSRHITCR